MEKKNGKIKKEKISGFANEFKTFIMKGNVMDLAVGVIIGSAFGKIVSSLVDDILMPLIGLIIGGHDFTNLTVQINKVTIRYGTFIQNVVDFLIVAFSIFIFIKLINRVTSKVKKEEKKEEETKVSQDILLLEEIRDILKKKTK